MRSDRTVGPVHGRSDVLGTGYVHVLMDIIAFGEHTIENTELRCRPHNQYEANRDYGRAHMELKRRGSRLGESVLCYGPQATRSSRTRLAHSPEKRPG